MFNTLTIDSTRARTELCDLGAKYGTDKSPYNSTSESGHKHPYTAIYDALFSAFKYQIINVGEIGILNNRSMKCWREYFPYANLYGWDFDHQLLQQAISDGLHNATYAYMNVYELDSIDFALRAANCLFDILIEDTTHQLDDQIRVASVAHKYLKPGAYFVIEDVFKSIPEDQYKEALAPLERYYHNITFVMTEHAEKVSTGWDNDRLIIFNRNNVT